MLLLLLATACRAPDERAHHPRPPLDDSAADTAAGDTASTDTASADTGGGTDTARGPNELTLHMIDVWQGDGLLLVAPDGTTLLVDAGDEGTWPHLWRYLNAHGAASLDYTLVSHQHADHMGAMDLVLLDHPEVRAAFDGGGVATATAYDDYVAAAGDRRQTVVVGDTLDLGEGVTVDVLHSDIGDRDNENNNSVVIRVTHGDVTFLLGGDCESLVCESALDTGPIDVYKVHHHGSSDSSARPLIDAMQPKIALVSVGAGNDYGHPAGSTMRALVDAGAEVWRTDQEGDVIVRSDGVDVTVEAATP